MLISLSNSLLLCLLAVVHLAYSIEVEATVEAVNASKWDTRDSTDGGCGLEGEDGCVPTLTVDGLLSDVASSRWSCHEDEVEIIGDPCYIWFDLGASFNLTRIFISFYRSNESERSTNTFEISVSIAGKVFTPEIEGENIIPTPLGTGNDFPLAAEANGRYVRLTGTNADEHWLSVSEVQIYVDVVTPAPAWSVTPPPTLNPTGAPTSSPVMPTAAPTITAENSLFTPAPAFDICSAVTVDGAGQLSGDYVISTANETTMYISSEQIGATLSYTEGVTATCTDNTETGCTVSKWTIKPDKTDTYSVYQVFDAAVHPALISETWLRLTPGCAGSDGECTNVPADVSIACQDGSFTAVPTPSPETTSTCDIVEVVGTQSAELDGNYYMEGDVQTGTTAFDGYQLGADGVSLIANGNILTARSSDGACSSSTASSSSSLECSYKQWWVRGPDPSSDRLYFTFDESQHPVDIPPGSLWYTSLFNLLPYDGQVNISCAPSAAPRLVLSNDTTPSPVLESGSPLGATDTSDSAGASVGADTAVIAGGVGVGLALLLAGAAGVVCWMKVSARDEEEATPQDVPPSYASASRAMT